MIKLSLYYLAAVFAFTAFPISITVIHAINIASSNALSHVSSLAINNLMIGCGIMLAVSSVIILLQDAFSLFFAQKDDAKTSRPFHISFLLGSTALSGVAICGFLLDTLNQIRNQPHLHETFALIIKNDPMQLQNLLTSEPALISGITICSLVLVGCLARIIYHFSITQNGRFGFAEILD